MGSVHAVVEKSFRCVFQEEEAAGAAEEQPQQEAGPEDDAEYEYMADGAAREAGESQALGPATEEQAAELHGANRPDQGVLHAPCINACTW